MLSHALVRPPSVLDVTSGQRSFLDDVPLRLQARQICRAYEDFGQPVCLVGISTAAATGMRRAISWLAEDDPDTALRRFTRLRDINKSSQFAEQWLACASVAVVDGLADATCAYIEVMADILPTVAGPPPKVNETGRPAHRPGEIRHEQTRAALQLGRMLLPRLTEQHVLRLVDACLRVRTTWRGGEWQTWGDLGKTARIALEHLANERRGERLLAVVRQPLIGRDVNIVQGNSDDNDPIFAFLQRALDGTRRDASWNETISDLLEVAASNKAASIREQAMQRLWALYTRELLNEEEKCLLIRVNWEIDNEIRTQQELLSFLDGTNIEILFDITRKYPLPFWTLIYFPEPARGIARQLVRIQLSRSPLPRFKADDVNAWTSKPRQYDDPVDQILMATARPWNVAGQKLEASCWSIDQISSVLGFVEQWWDDEGSAFIHHLQSAPTNLFPHPWWRLTTIIDFIAYVILPACVSHPEVLHRCVNLANEFSKAKITTDILVPLRLAAGTISIADGGALLREASSMLDSERSLGFLNAVLLWTWLAENKLVSQPPTDLVGEVAGRVRARRPPDLAWSLQTAKLLLVRPGEPWTKAMMPDLLIGLQHLAHETQPDAQAHILAIQDSDIMALRTNAASLLDTLAPHLSPTHATVRAWLDGIEAEMFISIREKLLSAKRNLGAEK